MPKTITMKKTRNKRTATEQAKDTLLLYLAAMQCGLVAVTALQMGMPVGDMIVVAGAGSPFCASRLIDAIKDAVEAPGPLEENLQMQYALILRAAGDCWRDLCCVIGMQMAEKDCPERAVLATHKGQWVLRQIVERWYGDVTEQICVIAQEQCTAVAAVAAVLIKEGEISGEEAEKIIHDAYERDVAAGETRESFACPH